MQKRVGRPKLWNNKFRPCWTRCINSFPMYHFRRMDWRLVLCKHLFSYPSLQLTSGFFNSLQFSYVLNDPYGASAPQNGTVGNVTAFFMHLQVGMIKLQFQLWQQLLSTKQYLCYLHMQVNLIYPNIGFSEFLFHSSNLSSSLHPRLRYPHSHANPYLFQTPFMWTNYLGPLRGSDDRGSSVPLIQFFRFTTCVVHHGLGYILSRWSYGAHFSYWI